MNEMFALKKAGVVGWCSFLLLCTFTTDTAGKLDVLGHDGDPLGMDCAQVGVLKQTNKVSLTGLLEGHHSRALEPEVSFEVLSDFTDHALEGELADEKLCGLLVASDFTQCNCSRPVSVGLLHSSSSRGRLSGSLSGKLLPGGLASGRFPGSLLGTSHDAASEETNDGLHPSAPYMSVCNVP